MRSAWYIAAMILPVVLPVLVLVNGARIRAFLIRRHPFISELNILCIMWTAMIGVMLATVAILGVG